MSIKIKQLKQRRTGEKFYPYTSEKAVLRANGESIEGAMARIEPEVIYDVTANNDGTTFPSLSALLSSENLSTIIPTPVRRGGITIRFIRSSDNKYVQYRLMKNTWSTTVSDWQGVDDEPVVGSENLVKSGGVADSINQLKNAGYLYAGIATPTTNPGTPDGSVFYIANGNGTYTNFGGIDVTDDEVVILYYDTSWHKEATGIASNDKLTELDDKVNGKVIIQTFTGEYQWGNTIDTIPSGTKVKNVGTIDVKLYDVIYGSIHTEFAPNQEKVLTHDVTCLRSVRDAGEAKISLYEGLINSVGDLSTLQTSNKHNLVSAINEVNAKFTEPIVIPDDSVGYNNLSEELKNEIFEIYEIKGKNLFNPNDADYKIGYLSDNTGYVQLNNPSYFTSGFVAVEPGKTYYCGKIGALWPNNVFSFALFYDNNKTPIGERLSDQVNLVAPTNASYLRVSMDTGALEEMMISEGQQYPYEPYTYLSKKVINTEGVIIGNDKLEDNSISHNKLDEALQRKIDSGGIIIKPNGMSIRGNLADGEQLELPKNSVLTDKVISFSANISSFSKLIIGHGYTNLDGVYFEIDATNIKDGIAGSTKPHELIIVNNIQVTIIKKSNEGSKIIIASNGTEKEFSIWNGYGNGAIFAKSEGSVLTNCSLSFMANNIIADTWVFGDSYFSLASNRWIYYLARDGFNHVMLNGYSGESTDKAWEDLTNLLVMNTPKRIVWCMGMNDPDYNGAVGVRWKKIYDQLLPLCTEKNIELVLSTIPTVIGGISADDVSGNNGKFRPHAIKNQIVKSSGYRYIDFENAVGADAQTGLWFGTTQQDIIDKTDNGMLSKDGVHPTIKGAIALYHQALSDCPELCGL